MTFIDINYDEIYDYDWLKVERFALVTVHKNDGTKVQIYPNNVLLGGMESSDELKKYDDRGWKQYYCSGFHSNGFTPSNLIGTCRPGCYGDLVEIVDIILSKKEGDIDD